MEFFTFIILLILILSFCILFFAGDGFFVSKNINNSINSIILLSNNDHSIDDYI